MFSGDTLALIHSRSARGRAAVSAQSRHEKTRLPDIVVKKKSKPLYIPQC